MQNYYNALLSNSIGLQVVCFLIILRNLNGKVRNRRVISKVCNSGIKSIIQDSRRYWIQFQRCTSAVLIMAGRPFIYISAY